MPIKPTAKKEKLHNPFRVLVTGFGPFQSYGENPSWLAVKPLQDVVLSMDAESQKAKDVPLPSKPRPIHLSTLQIPVVYDSVLELVPGLHSSPPILPSDAPNSSIPPPYTGYDFILHVGVGDPGGLAVETLAHKLGYFMKDVEGKYPTMTRNSKRGFGGEEYDELPDELETDIDVTSLVKDLKRLRTEPVVQSTDPGLFLCDFIFYCSLATAKRCVAEDPDRKRTQVLFLHCPPIGQPLVPEQVTEAIKRIVVWVCCKQQLVSEA